MTFLQQLPPEIATMILAMLPFTELRASIPVGIKVFGLSPFEALFASVIGNMIPVVLLLLLIKPVTDFAHKHARLLERILQWLYTRVQKKLKGKESYEGLALALFVGIPLPGTGAWTGALVAFLLGIPFKRSFPFIFLGVLIAGLIITLISTGVFASLDF